jgi:tape measure domain-containing protein
MATLYFKVSSDWEQVVKLRQECEKLETQLKKMDSRSAPAATKTLETQLASTKQQMMGLVTEAAKAGAEMENGFKKKIYDASQTVNGLSEKIIAQRAVIKDIEFDVKRLGDAYRTALKNNPIGASGKLAEYNAARRALDEEKAALFGLTQQQAEARLSVKKLRDEYSLYKKEAGDTVEINNGLSMSWGKMLGVIGGATALKSLASQIVRVRGEFQSMQTAIETMVGKDVASGLMAQLKEMAKISPLTLTDMVDAEKMMLGFNIQAEDTVRYLQALSDISMGDSVKFKSLTLAFSQMSAAGKLMGQDLNQMINAGFNPLQIIAEKTGKSIATLKDEMSKGAVSAEMVQQAFIDATSAGGKFYQMSENASKTINGQLSMMQDALDNAFNEMGKVSEGIIMEGIQLTTTLIQNYETVGKVLVGLVATYGAYRTAVMLATIATSKHTIAEVALTNARVIARKAQLLLNAAMLTNPYVAVATVVTALAASIWVLSTRTSEAEKATERFNTIMDEHNKKEEEHKQAVDALISTIQDQNKAEGERLAAFEKLKAEYPTIFQNYTTETEFLKEIVKYKRLIAEEDARRSTSSLEEQLRIEQNRLNHYRQVRASGTSTSLVDMDGNGWASDNVEDAIKAQTQIVNSLKAQISTPLVNSYLESIKTLKDEDIKSVLDEITLSMKSLGDSGKDAIAIVASLGGEFSKEQLGMIKSALETEQKSRSERTSYAEDYEQARKDWEEAKKELQKIESDKDKFTSKQYEDAKKRVESTEKAYKKLGGLTGTALSKQQKEADKEKKSRQKLSDQLLALQEKNQQAEVNLMKEGTEKKLAQIDADYSAQKAAIARQQRDLAESNKQSGITSTNANGLTTDQQAEIDRANELAAEARKKQIEEVYRAEAEAMRSYLAEYGTFQQQKLAISQEYARKIADAQTEGDRLSLEKERDQKLSGMEAEALKMSIDWPAVFGEFGGMFDDIMKPTLEKVKQYMQTDDFRNLQPTDQSEIVEAVNRMEQSLGGAGKVSFKQLGKEVQTLQQSMRELNNAKLEEAEALQRLAEAQEAYENALANGTDMEKAAAELKLNAAKEEADNASENTRKAEENAQQNQKTTTETATTLKANMENVTQGLQQLASGGIQAAYEGLLKLAKGSGNDKMGEISDKLGDVFIIGWILSILDILKDGLSTVVEGLLDGIFSAVSGILSDVLSGDLFVTLFDSIKSGVGSILDAITFGGFSSWTSSSNAKEVQATIDRLTDRNEALQQSIDALNDTMKEARGTETVKAAKQAEEYQKEVNQNYLEMAMAQAGYHGSHHSWNYYWGGFSKEQIDKLSEQIGREWSGSLWDLSPEEMKMLKGNVDMWTQIQNTGEGGYGGRLTEKLDDYIDQAGKLEEITDTLYESLTQISFDSMYDSFVDNLMNMEYSAQDAADDIAEYFMRAMLSNKIGTLYQDKLEEWYKKFAGAMEDDGTLDDGEIAALRDEYLGYVEEALKLRDELAAATGYEGTSAQEQQSASSRGFGTEMTHEDAGELSGRFTAVYESNLRIETAEQQQTVAITELRGSISALTSQATGLYNIADDTRTILADSYLEIQKIRENTGEIIKPIKQIQKDIAEVKKNTLRT